ncbi:MAG: DUF6922 domain-containing protein [Candidatus Levyibacteriota bacterium]
MVHQPLPPYITQYFWGDDLSQLDLEKNKKYIIQTLLEKGDNEALHWLFSNIDRQTILNFMPELKLSKKSQHFWNIYFA